MFCGACGEDLLPNSKFCANCGSAVDVINSNRSNGVGSHGNSNHQIRHDPYKSDIRGSSGYQKSTTQSKLSVKEYKEMTGWLTLVIIINYVGLALIVILAIWSLFLSFFLGVLYLLLAWFINWLIKGLKEYDNTRRGIVVVLLIISFIVDLVDFNFFALVFGGTEIYALVFHKPTVRLFD